MSSKCGESCLYEIADNYNFNNTLHTTNVAGGMLDLTLVLLFLFHILLMSLLNWK